MVVCDNMLKIQTALDFIPENKTKCGEIFYHSLDNFTIFCTFCQMKSFQLDDFILHVQNVHLTTELEKTLCHSRELRNYIKLNVKKEMNCYRKEEDKVLQNNMEQAVSDSSEDDIESCKEVLKVLKKTRRKSISKEFKLNTTQADIDEDFSGTLSNFTKKAKVYEYTCTECYKTFLQKKCLDQHVQDLHNGYKCSLCDKRFSRSSNVAYHLKTHTAVKKFICTMENCGRGFIDEEYLKRHLEIHTMERNFICDYDNCGKAFQTQRRLASHEYTHRIPKKFVCDMCGFGCRSSTVLITHQRVHTGEKPFPCEVCSKPFRSKTALREHMISHSETRPHVCSICNKAFANRRVLVRHSFIHSDEKTFKCKMCASVFKHPNSLQGHIRHVHCEPKQRHVKELRK